MARGRLSRAAAKSSKNLHHSYSTFADCCDVPHQHGSSLEVSYSSASRSLGDAPTRAQPPPIRRHEAPSHPARRDEACVVRLPYLTLPAEEGTPSHKEQPALNARRTQSTPRPPARQLGPLTPTRRQVIWASVYLTVAQARRNNHMNQTFIVELFDLQSRYM